MQSYWMPIPATQYPDRIRVTTPGDNKKKRPVGAIPKNWSTAQPLPGLVSIVCGSQSRFLLRARSRRHRQANECAPHGQLRSRGAGIGASSWHAKLDCCASSMWWTPRGAGASRSATRRRATAWGWRRRRESDFQVSCPHFVFYSGCNDVRVAHIHTQPVQQQEK